MIYWIFIFMFYCVYFSYFILDLKYSHLLISLAIGWFLLFVSSEKQLLGLFIHT